MWDKKIELSLRYIKTCMVASIALFFSVVAFDNIIDFQSNWLFVQHVLTMDTTFQSPALMVRAINSSFMHRCIYYLIITWEIVTAIVCWWGCFALLAKRKANQASFNEAKKIAFIGLFLGFFLYMVAFMIIGGEWFSMWQSATWNGQMKAGLFINLIMFIMIFLKIEKAQ